MDDVDMDIDFTEDNEMEALQAQADRIAEEAANITTSLQQETMNGSEEVTEEGEVNQMEPVAKVHIRGLEQFKPRDVEDYAAEHFSTDLFKRVQWIDDNHANFIYDTEAAAEEALQAFSAEEMENRLQFRPAKPLSTHPNVKLEVRQAVISDVKVPGAKDRSRFYLMNPEYDPDSRPKRRQQNGRGQKRGGRAYEGDRYSRRSSGDGTPFDESFYDDDAGPVATRKDLLDTRANCRDTAVRRDSGTRTRTSRADLFAGKENGRLQDSRSRSPTRDGDGRYGFQEDQPQRQTARHRSRTPPHLHRNTTLEAREKKRRELFPEKKTAKELFPNRTQGGLSQDQVAKAIGEIRLPRDDGAGFEFKGKSRVTDDEARNGFSILGASKVKELFPNRGPNQGRDLFEGHTAGRSTLRNKAEDLF